MSAYYVMSECEGNECMVRHCPTWGDARKTLAEESSLDPHAKLSIWDSRGGMLLLWDCVHGNQYTKAGLAIRVQS